MDGGIVDVDGRRMEVRWDVAVRILRCRPRSAIRAVGAELAVHKLASGSAIVASTIKGVTADVHAMQILSHRAAQMKDEQHAMFHHSALKTRGQNYR